MTDLLIILLFIVIGLCFVLRKPKFPTPQEILKEALDKRGYTETEKPIIEDSSHLKDELAETKQLYTAALQQMGQFQSEIGSVQRALEVKCGQYMELASRFDKLQHQNKSSQVKTGTFVEILSPISEQFPVDPKTMRFLGSPIDYISFDYETDMITMVEVKSGESQLNTNQKAVKSMVERGRVQFKVVRLNEKGIKIK